ncbi:hypothetical protein M434DRAFT_35401 [Hypoxylon sp. CO27-5]|nr:hypothetical protein M434DRAFT_35401 [Hypoxylon sp. CO27-5]
MAEVLGVAASGIAIAQISTQVGSTVLKLKRLWDEVKDVPDDIADLMEQIECLNPTIWEIENNFDQSGLPPCVWDELASKSTAMYCHKALKNLTGMVDELSLHINNAKKGRRKIAAIKVLLQKDSLRKLERRLENAVRMLTLAQQSYLVALTRVQPDIIVEKFTALTLRDNQAEFLEASNPESERGSERENRVVSNSLARQPNKLGTITKPLWKRKFDRPNLFGRVLVEYFASGCAVLFQAPTWLSQRSWELHSIKANGNWQCNLISYSIVPEDSKVLGLAAYGSPQDMQKLFDAGLASPYDCNHFGWTLLHQAAIYHNVEMIRYLIRIGLSPSPSSSGKSYPAHVFPFRAGDPYSDAVQQILSDTTLAKKFLVFSELDFEYDESIQDSSANCHCISGLYSIEVFKALLPYQCPLHQNLPLASRVKAAALALNSWDFCPDVVRFMLEPEWSTNPQAISRNAGTSILIDTALQLISSVCDRESTRRTAASVFTFAVDVIRRFHAADPDTMCSKEDGTTVLVEVLHWPLRSHYGNHTLYFKATSLVLTVWLEALKQAGVDLNAYGRCEREIFAYNEFIHYFGRVFHDCDLSSYLVDFSYGPEPDDWKLYWREPSDEFAGDFWKLIEDPPLHIPGSWID